GSLYLRDLEFKRTDLFYVGIADLTVSKNSASASAKLQEGENDPQPYDSSLDGRLAFYVNGNVRQNWRLTARAGNPRRPGEGPVQQLPGQVARFVIPAHRSGLFLPVVRRRWCCARNGPNHGQVLRQSEQWRELRDVGQFQGRLFG